MLTQTLLVALSATLAAAVKPLEVQGEFFVDPSTGNRFQVVGAAYQPGGSAGYGVDHDPLSNPDACLRDAALLQMLGVNTIRVYNLSPDLNHDICASIFNAAGIYMVLDVNSPLVGESLSADEPWTTYNKFYVNRTCAVVEAFKNYPNTLAFFSGNEVIQDPVSPGTAPPYIRAITRDLKNYIKKHSSRYIPVGYSAADVRDYLFDTFEYLQCNNNDDSRADLYAMNSYSFCGQSDFVTSTYKQLVDGFTGTSIPLFFSEYGCNKPAPRIFAEVPVIYSSNMTGVFSGGVVYEYAQEANDYGLVNISADGSAQIMPDYVTFKNQLAKLDFTQIQGIKPPTSSPNPPVCDTKLITHKDFNSNFTIPAVLDEIKPIIDNGVTPTPSGKIVSITDWKVKQTVKNPDGTVVTGLEVKPLANDAINSPGSNSASSSGSPTTTGSSTTSPSASSTTSKNAAPGSGPGQLDIKALAITMGVPVVTFLVGFLL